MFLSILPDKLYNFQASSMLAEDLYRLFWGQKDAILFWNIRSAKCTVLETNNVASILYNINLKEQTEWQPLTFQNVNHIIVLSYTTGGIPKGIFPFKNIAMDLDASVHSLMEVIQVIKP